MPPSTPPIVNTLDELFAALVQSIPKGMEVQVFLNEDGYNCKLISDQFGTEARHTLNEIWNCVSYYSNPS